MTTDPLVVTRTFALGSAEFAPVAAALTAMGGVHEVHAAGEADHVRISYDLRHLRLADVERVMQAAGVAPARGILAALRRNWAAFTEENKLASVRAEVRPCCSRPPK